MLAGTAVIYLLGVSWLAHDLGVDSTTAIGYGLTPFVIGDLLKLAVAGLVLPVAWNRLGKRWPADQEPGRALDPATR
jgi:biotin transport system substrate-specific component